MPEQDRERVDMPGHMVCPLSPRVESAAHCFLHFQALLTDRTGLVDAQHAHAAPVGRVARTEDRVPGPLRAGKLVRIAAGIPMIATTTTRSSIRTNPRARLNENRRCIVVPPENSQYAETNVRQILDNGEAVE